MANKHWEAWLKIVFIPLFIITTTADFTTECQRPCDCRWQSGNKAAICSNSSLKVVPTNLSNDIQILELSNNNIQQLHSEAFKKAGLSNLKKLFLRECNLEIVHKTTFVTLAIMIELDLSKNKIRYLHPDTFKGTEKLRLINLSNNLIDKLEDGLFRNMKFLQKVEASNNRIVRIGTKAFVNLPQLKILRFDGNNLSHMKLETLIALKNLSGLDLHNNPWRCDCNLQTFRDWVISHNLYTAPTSCAEPVSVQGKLWNELDSSNFACRPTILEPLPDSTVRSYDENVTLTCKVVGNPPPDVSWRFNGRVIEMKTFGELRYAVNENIMDLIKWVNLTIINARYSDRGNYSCVAENPGGRDEKTLGLVLTKYGGSGLIAGLDTDSFAIIIGCLTAIVIIFGVTLVVCYFTTQNNEIKRLIKNDPRSSNGEVLIEGSVNSDNEKGIKMDVNPVTKPPRKYDVTPSLTNEATEMSELNKTLLDNETALATSEDSRRHQEAEFPKISQETLVADRYSQDQTYPPDLLSFPLRAQISSTGTTKQTICSPIKSPTYADSSDLYSRFQSPNVQGSFNPKGYVTLPRRPRFPEGNPRPQVFSTLNGVIPYYDTFNMKLFHGGNYYSLNKSEMDLGPMTRVHYNEEEIEPAPSPAPGTPHATIPRSSISSPNIHNQLLNLQAMANSDNRPLKMTLVESESLLKSPRDLRIAYSGNAVSGTLGRRTAPKPPPKPRKKNSCEVKDPFLMNNDIATQV
ncbi:amphoterin-induced protein 1-like [Bombyx mandarina]|uniref:Hemolin n=1 Tax=Bombyx mandarina TaxID=7092 RepID=A0A6J2JAA1_BOMMA|nr:amphoterin-induced protein 1-like [Bombyx mandarina]